MEPENKEVTNQGKIIVFNRRNFEAIFSLRLRDRIYAFFGRIFQRVFYCGWHRHVHQCRKCNTDCTDRIVED